jgi:hypothetical protein
LVLEGHPFTPQQVSPKTRLGIRIARTAIHAGITDVLTARTMRNCWDYDHRSDYNDWTVK